MKRSAFKTKAPPPRPVRQMDYTPRPRATASAAPALRLVQPIEKDAPERDEAYRRLVAALPCSNCGIAGHSQAAHGPTLGARIKASDADVFPLCCDRPGVVGCHYQFDNYQLCDAADRYRLAEEWAAMARARAAA